MPRPRQTFEPPSWFDLANYAVAEEIDAADWYVNLALRAAFYRGALRHLRVAIRSVGAVIRRDSRLPPQLAFPSRQLDPDVTRILGGESPRLGVWHLTCDELYFFERRLPRAVRSFAADVAGETVGGRRPPPEFRQPVDHSLQPRQLSQFVRIDLTRPDDVLVEDLRVFLRGERRALGNLAGEYPAATALRVLGKCNKANLKTFARIGLLPFLDLELWRTENAKAIAPAAYARLLHVGPEDVREARKKAKLVLNDFILRGWLLPRARVAMEEITRSQIRKLSP